MTSEALKRELHETVHVVRIKRGEKELLRRSPDRMENKKSALASSWMKDTLRKFSQNNVILNIREYIRESFERKQNLIIIIFLIIGVVIFFGLVSYLINALFSATSSQTKDAKNQIIQAKTLLESSKKLISNPSSFDATIKDTEKILSDLETKQLYIKDVQEIRDKIEAMKKEIYDIQVVELS